MPGSFPCMGEELPGDIPSETVRVTKVAAVAQGLATYRVLAPKALLAKEDWEASRNNHCQVLKAFD